MSAVLGYLLLLFLPVGAVGWIVWRHRRKSNDTEARRRERETALVEMVKHRAATAVAAAPPNRAADNTVATAIPAAAVAPARSVPASPPAAPATATEALDVPAAAPEAVSDVVGVLGIGRRDRFLSHSETLIYLLLRTAIPGHEIFPRVALASVITDLPPPVDNSVGPNRHDLDFVVCDRRMRVVAAVQVRGRLSGPDRSRVEDSLAAAGIRLVTVDLTALPKREELAARVLGSGMIHPAHSLSSQGVTSASEPFAR
jgi:hypothetical protein